MNSKILARLASLNLPTEAFQQVLSIIAEMQAADDLRRQRQRERKARSRDMSVTVTGQERDCHKKEIPPTPPKENSSSEFPRGNSSAADAARAVYTDSKHELWGEGVPILVALGVPERSARSNIGRWLREAKDDAQTVLGAIQRARDNRIFEPIPWITRAIKPGQANVAEARSLTAVSRRVAADAARAAGMGDEPGEPVLRVVSQG